MKTAWQLAQEWALVPEWKVEPDDEKKGYREAFRAKLDFMREAFERRVRQMRRPPSPGPRPLPYAPPPLAAPTQTEIPETALYAAARERAAKAYAAAIALTPESGPEIIKAGEAALVASREAERVARIAEELARDKLNRDAAAKWGREVNDVWLDTKFYPNEAEHVIWQASKTMLDDWVLDKRAAMLLRADWIRSWAPLVAYVGVGIGVLVAGVYVAWNGL